MVLSLSIVGASLIACNSGVALTDNQKRGKQMYEGLCNRCHSLIPPTKFNDTVWSAAASKYGSRLKLTREEIGLIADYLTHANDIESKD